MIRKLHPCARTNAWLLAFCQVGHARHRFHDAVLVATAQVIRWPRPTDQKRRGLSAPGHKSKSRPLERSPSGPVGIRVDKDGGLSGDSVVTADDPLDMRPIEADGCGASAHRAEPSSRTSTPMSPSSMTSTSSSSSTAVGLIRRAHEYIQVERRPGLAERWNRRLPCRPERTA